MKNLPVLFTVILLFSAVGANAQTSTWDSDYKAALTEAKKSGNPILVNFSGSDWCKWCIKLDQEVFSKKAFKKYADENLVLLLVDTPARKKLPADVAKQNDTLKSKFKIRGFPTVLLIDGDGNVINQTGYQYGGPEKYVEHLKGLIKGS